MHKILVVSDTHRKDENFYRVIDIEKDVNLIIHCGDTEGSETQMQQLSTAPMRIVKGNNDFFSNLPDEQEFEVWPHRFFVTHGHRYLVNMGSTDIRREALVRGADVVIYGHTHKPVAAETDGIYVFNPGSLSYPRQEGRKPSYLILTIDDEGELTYEIKYLELF
jgi:putative phosphoesterase